jgi:cytochrome c oxidase subunit 3
MSDHNQEDAAPPIGTPRVAIQFQDLAKQDHAAHLGMWIFLGSELLLFAALFGLYTAYRTEYSVEFGEAVHHNALWIGTTNVVILILSSFSVAWAVHSLRRGRRRVALWSLAFTMLAGVMFLVFKGIEYGLHFREGVFPGQYYRFHEMPGHGAQLFFTLYYFMTGLHALHMLGGLTAIAWVTRRVSNGKTSPARPIALELSALYWHLVDSIWIFLWPMFYLTTR